MISNSVTHLQSYTNTVIGNIPGNSTPILLEISRERLYHHDEHRCHCTPHRKIHSFLSEVSVWWSCGDTRPITLRALPATFSSFQQSPQLRAVAATSSSCCNIWKLSSIHFLEVSSKCQTEKLIPSHRNLSPVTARYNYIIIATFEG